NIDAKLMHLRMKLPAAQTIQGDVAVSDEHPNVDAELARHRGELALDQLGAKVVLEHHSGCDVQEPHRELSLHVAAKLCSLGPGARRHRRDISRGREESDRGNLLEPLGEKGAELVGCEGAAKGSIRDEAKSSSFRASASHRLVGEVAVEDRQVT